MNGSVVHAIAGQRSAYRPIRSTLSSSSDPRAIARALLDAAPFGCLYVADLDAIMQEGRGPQIEMLRALCAVVGSSGGELWLDAGWFDGGRAPWRASLAAAAGACGARLVWVVGSESLAVVDLPVDADCVLSLDFRASDFFGPVGLDCDAQAWPRRVIVMDLAVVGADRGPAFDALERLRCAAAAAGRTDVAFFVAGGVRNCADLEALAEKGAQGALVASSLHSGRIDAAALRRFRKNAHAQ